MESKFEITKENRFMIIKNIEKDKKMSFCLKDKKFYNDKEKEVKVSTAKTFLKDLTFDVLPLDNNVVKVGLLLKYFKIVLPTITNFGTVIEKYTEYEFIESWLTSPYLFKMLYSYDDKSADIKVPYNKIDKNIKMIWNKHCGTDELSNIETLNSCIEYMCKCSMLGYDYTTEPVFRRKILESGIVSPEYLLKNKSRNSKINMENTESITIKNFFELFNLQSNHIRIVEEDDQKTKKDKTAKINKINTLICKLVFEQNKLSFWSLKEMIQYALRLIYVYNHDEDRTFTYCSDIIKAKGYHSAQWLMGLYLDYFEMRTNIYFATAQEKELTQAEINSMLKSGRYPKFDEIREQHDLSIKVLNNLKIEYNDMLFNMRKDNTLNDSSIEGWIFRVPDKPKELAIEGAVLGNCVESYIKRVTSGECQIVLLRPSSAPNSPNVVFEVRDNAIVQLEGKSRRRANMYESRAIREYIKNKKLTCKVTLERWKEPKKAE